MVVYRLATKQFANDLSGTGAATYGGRWNKKGMPVLYTGEGKEIALLETIVHTPPMLVPGLEMVTIEIPDNSITETNVKDLPENLFAYPAPTVLSEIGENWAQKAETIALKVPSCIIYSACNFILNCRHPEFYKKVKIKEQKEFYFDSRLTN